MVCDVRYSDSRNGYVWGDKTEIWKAEYLQATVRHGGSGVMVWAGVKSELILFDEQRLNGQNTVRY